MLACLGMGEAFLVSAPPASRHFLQRDLPLKCGAHKIARQRPSARGLRMQYVAELRALQSHVNGVVACAQEFTANPKTDSQLGRVGR